MFCRQIIESNMGGCGTMKVSKHSCKPFKSGNKINTVKGEVVHPITGHSAFTFVEDDSIIEPQMCKEEKENE